MGCACCRGFIRRAYWWTRAQLRRPLSVIPGEDVGGFQNSRLVSAILSLCCCASLTLYARAQGELLTVEKLYAAASYEEALALLDEVELVGGVDTLESAEYRILCLLALEQFERAQIAMEKLVAKYPRYRPDPSRFSPHRREQFEAVRRLVLPRIIQTKYAEARASFDAKDYEDAIGKFEVLLTLMNDDAKNEPQLADLRTFASDFLALARLTAAADMTGARPVGTSGPATKHGSVSRRSAELAAASTATTGQPPVTLQETASWGAGHASLYDASSSDVVPPVPLKPILPPVSRDVSIVTPSPGLFEILVDERGRVESAFVRRSINSEYDARVLQESRNWRFKPATRHGEPVKFRKLIEIYAVPLASLAR
jgi:TonB family protein